MTKKITPEQEQEIIKLYKAGLSGLEIAKQFTYPKNNVYKILKIYNIDLNNFFFTDKEKERMINLYLSGKSCKEISEIIGCNKCSVEYILKKSKVKKRHGEKFLSSEDEQKVIELWQSKYSQKEISQLMNISIKRIKKILILNNLDSSSRYAVLERHGNWNGGRSCTTTGYVLIKLLKDDPFFCMTNYDGYVLEHRYIMAKHFGRPLASSEQVHHKDGNRQNNTIGNLQLRHSNHGNGQKFICCDCGSHNVKPEEI